jgi:hypothetical protein
VLTTARIAAVLAFALTCTPAHALSMKDYEAKSDAEKTAYLKTCIANLIVDLGKTNPALASKAKSYYYDKAPGRQYPEGTYDLVGRIVRLEQQAEKDKSVDLSKTTVEELVMLTTAAKFKIPVPPEFQRTGEPSAKPPPAAPNAAPPPSPAPRAAAPVDDDDPIGGGGFITPPTEAVMQICVSADFAPAWENPSAGSEMADFRGIIGDFILHTGKNGEQFRLKDSAYGIFESARQAAPPRTPLLNSFVDRLAAGQHCPSTDRVYNVQRKPPAK